LDWSKNDKYLISSSADCQVKVWYVQKKKFIDGTPFNLELEEEENDKFNLKAIINHPSYVYAAKCIPIDIGQ
jgi:WD40 repeat protein